MNRFNFSIILLALVLAACAGNSQVVTTGRPASIGLIDAPSVEHQKQEEVRERAKYLEALKAVGAVSEGFQPDGTTVTCTHTSTMMLCSPSYPDCNIKAWNCRRHNASQHNQILAMTGATFEGFQPDGSLVRCEENGFHPDKLHTHIAMVRTRALNQAFEKQCTGKNSEDLPVDGYERGKRFSEFVVNFENRYQNPWVCVKVIPDAFKECK